MNLRPYQREALDAIHEQLETKNSTLAVLPTGTGKTIIFGQLIHERLSLIPRGRAMVLTHRKELIRQAGQQIERLTGLRCDVEMADERAGDGTWQGGAPIVVATVQTLASARRLTKFNPQRFSTLVCDEAHHYTAPMFRTPIDHFRRNPDLKVLGVSATPDRADEESLGQIFETVAYDYQLWDAIMDGWLVPLKHWAKRLVGLDLSKVHTRGGELDKGELARELAANENLEAIAAATVESAGTRRTLLFSDSVDNAERLTAILNGHRRGEARLLVGCTPDDERDEVVADYRAGRFQYLVNVGVCTEGFDVPEIACVSLARPTKSRSLAAQMIGRGTRPAESIADTINDLPNDMARRAAIAAGDKPDLLVIDFVDNTYRHDLMHPADVLGGRISDRAVELANRQAREERPIDVIEELERAEATIRRNDELIRAERDRKGVRAVIADSSDPFSIYGLSRRARRGWEKDLPMRNDQYQKLKRWRIKKFETLGYGDAEQIIEEVRSRARRGLLTLNQEIVLKRFGYNCKDVSFEVARQRLDALAVNGWKRPQKALT